MPPKSRSMRRGSTNVPRPRVALQALLARQLRQGAADGDQAAAVARGELALRREPIAGRPVAGVERRREVEVDLVVQRDGPSSRRNRAMSASRDDRGAEMPGLVRACRLVITL